MKRNDFILLPPSDMKDISLGLQEAEDMLNELARLHSPVMPEAVNIEETLEKERCYYVIKKILRKLGFEYGYYDENDRSLTFGGKRLWRELSDDEARELGERRRNAERLALFDKGGMA